MFPIPKLKLPTAKPAPSGFSDRIKVSARIKSLRENPEALQDFVQNAQRKKQEKRDASLQALAGQPDFVTENKRMGSPQHSARRHPQSAREFGSARTKGTSRRSVSPATRLPAIKGAQQMVDRSSNPMSSARDTSDEGERGALLHSRMICRRVLCNTCTHVSIMLAR